MNMKYLPDRPLRGASEDLLDFRTTAGEALKQIAASEPPFTWGVFGDWGSGKTSLMRLIVERMEEQLHNPPEEASVPLHIPVWFEAWRYENEINIIYPLFHAIRDDFENRCSTLAKDEAFVKSFKDIATASLLGLTDLALRAATNKVFGESLTLENISDHLTQAEVEMQTVFDHWVDQVTKLQREFDTFVQTYIDLYSQQHQAIANRSLFLAIFVDDLDRCLPDVAIAILERIKNHLKTDKCVFILGINRNVVYQSIRKKYGNLQIDGRQHLEKIIQHSMGVPSPGKDQVRNFVVQSLHDLAKQPSPEFEEYFEQFASVLDECRFINPRKIKRILNRYLSFLARHMGHDIDQFEISTLARLIVMREYYQDFYELFTEFGFQPFDLIAKYKGQEDSENEFILKCGAKWRPLIAEFDKVRRLAELTATPEKTAEEYDLAVRELFGRED